MKRLIDIEGIGPVYESKLKEIGINNQTELLRAGGTVKGRREICERSNVSSKLILKWINRCDLERINGVSEEYSDLLEHAGVDTVVELARRNCHNLHNALCETNKKGHYVRRLPSESTVCNWVSEAKTKKRRISY